MLERDRARSGRRRSLHGCAPRSESNAIKADPTPPAKPQFAAGERPALAQAGRPRYGGGALARRGRSKSSGAMVQFFESDGLRLAYIDVAPRGRDRGEPILLIHGFASNHRVNWVNPRWVETLTHDGRRVIAFDNRGHGESDKLDDPGAYHSALMAGDAAAPARPSRHRAGRRDGLLDGGAHRRVPGARQSRAGSPADPRRARRTAGRGRRPAARHRRRDGGAVARRPDRPDAAHVPRLRRADQERSRRARRLHPRLAPDA